MEYSVYVLYVFLAIDLEEIQIAYWLYYKFRCRMNLDVNATCQANCSFNALTTCALDITSKNETTLHYMTAWPRKWPRFLGPRLLCNY